MNKWKALIIKDSDFEQVWDVICDNNRKMILILNLICAVIVLSLMVLGRVFQLSFVQKRIPIFIFALVYVTMIIMLVTMNKTSQKAIMAATYLTIIGVMLYGIFVSYCSPTTHTVEFIGLVSIISMIFVDKPGRLGLIIIGGTIVCAVMSFFCKEESIRIVDVMNIISFSILSYGSGYFIINMKVHSYIVVSKIKDLGEKDLLTDLYNRNSFEQRVSADKNKLIRSFGCIYVDVNGLHEINNTKGHKAGDEMLQFVANTVKTEFGASDTYRIGGDEFVAFAIDVNKSEIIKKIDRMKSTIIQGGYHIAIGFEYAKGDVSVSDVLEIAEQKMRENKREFYANNPSVDRRSRD